MESVRSAQVVGSTGGAGVALGMRWPRGAPTGKASATGTPRAGGGTWLSSLPMVGDCRSVSRHPSAGNPSSPEGLPAPPQRTTREAEGGCGAACERAAERSSNGRGPAIAFSLARSLSPAGSLAGADALSGLLPLAR
eukprot:scaffold315200_cov36-Tisochrysis_lutea.AAC.1